MATFDSTRWVLSEPLCPYCAKCAQPNGVLQCIGCGKVFCSQDTLGHRKSLRQQLHDLLNRASHVGNKPLDADLSNKYNAQKIEDDRQRVEYDDYLAKIDRWQRESIEKIKKVADEGKDKLRQAYENRKRTSKALHNYDHYNDQVRNSLQALMDQMERAEKNDGFVEVHLEQWDRLVQWHENIKIPTERFQSFSAKIRLEQAIIEKLVVDVFVRDPVPMSSPPDLPDINALIPPYGLVSHATPLLPWPTQTELYSGEHRFRFKSECIYLGIACNKGGNRRSQQGEIPISYGWAKENQVYIDGAVSRDRYGHQTEMQLGDTFELIVNCDRRLISLTNERTGRTQELKVDERTCPLPWQMNVSFLHNVFSENFRAI